MLRNVHLLSLIKVRKKCDAKKDSSTPSPFVNHASSLYSSSTIFGHAAHTKKSQLSKHEMSPQSETLFYVPLFFSPALFSLHTRLESDGIL